MKGKKEKAGKTTLLEWILEKNDTKGWRTGKVFGERHPVITQEAVDRIGMEALLEQAGWLEVKGLIWVDWREFRRDIGRVHYRVEDVGRMYELAGKEDPRDKLKRAEAEVRFWLGQLKNADFKGYYEGLLRQIGGGDDAEKPGTALVFKGADRGGG